MIMIQEIIILAIILLVTVIALVVTSIAYIGKRGLVEKLEEDLDNANREISICKRDIIALQAKADLADKYTQDLISWEITEENKDNQKTTNQ
jgi:hypothetical protein